MAEAGYTPIQLYRSATSSNIPSAANLQFGELAINIADGNLFYKDSGGNVKIIASNLLQPANGGTGASNLTGYVYGNGSGFAMTASTTIPGSAISGNISGNAANVTGIVGVANGGTGLSSVPTNGQLNIGNGTGFTRNTLTAGSGISITNGAGSITIASTAGGGSVTSVGLTAPSFLTVTGSPITTAGTLALTLSGTALPVSSGGTGITSTPGNGQIDIGNGSGFTRSTLTAGSGISITNGAGSVTISATGAASGVTSFQTSLSGLTPSTATTGAVTLAGTLGVSSGGTGGTSLDGAGIVTKNGTQTITGNKTFDSSTTQTFNGTILSAAYNMTATGTSIYTQADGNGTTAQISTRDGVSSFSTKLILGPAAGATGGATYAGVASVALNWTPASDNTYTLGSSGLRWSTVYAATGTINTSDVRTKTDISDSTLGLSFINGLRPVSYKFIEGGRVEDGTYTETVDAETGNVSYIANTVPVPGTRIHYGLIAQEVKQLLDQTGVADFGGWVMINKDDPNSEQGLRYEEFISPLIKAVQELSAEVARLKSLIPGA